MNRKQFLDRLEMLLDHLPKEEREEALQYYRDYFDDAGEGNEALVIEELESPEKVAAVIRAGMEAGKDNYSEYGDTGYTDTRFEEKKVPESRSAFKETEYEYGDSGRSAGYEYGDTGRRTEYEYSGAGREKQKEPWTSDILKVILVVAIIIVAIPLAGPILLGLIFGVLGVVFGIAVAGIVLSVLGVSFIGIGIGRLVTFASGGIMLSGAGLVLLALGMLITVLVVKAGMKALPPLFRWFVDLLRRPFHGRTV